MKRILSIVMLACAVNLAASAQVQAQKPQKHGDKAEMAQRGKEMIQRMESEKIAFYTQAIGLTPEEAKDFWPIYNSVETDQKELIKAEHDAFKALNAAIKEGKGEKEIETLLNAYVKASEANVNLHFKAAGSYKAVLDPVKVAKFFAAQERFRRQQFNNLRGGHRGPGAPGQGGPGEPGQRGPKPGAPEQGGPDQNFGPAQE